MAKKGSWNPIAFRPVQVTLTASAVYIAVFAVLLWIHLSSPSAPTTRTPEQGLNLTQAWLDLDAITAKPHSSDSRQNDVVRKVLIDRIEAIFKENGVDYKVEILGGDSKKTSAYTSGPKPVTLIQDYASNATFPGASRAGSTSTVYHESRNIIVYIRGSEDEDGDWWHTNKTYEGKGGVLVNAHYDSVPTAYGATDDGVGVVSILQLLSYFTTEGRQPKRGILALLNNGEEDWLLGAHAFLRHPISQLPRTFLNLEGAGAGGRAVLFRSTDAEVTKFYGNSPRPFGSVIFADGFKRGFIRSGTDYSVFNGIGGMRGLDVAFFQPRSRYHTDQDDSRDTSIGSLWHMLSAAVQTVDGLANYEGDEFEAKLDKNGKIEADPGSPGVWFDVLGRGFALMNLPTFFALSVALLVAAPLLLILLEVVLSKTDRWYPFTRKQYLHGSDDDEAVQISGLRGFFRFPLVFIVSTAAVVALAYLLTKLNPYIMYSSEYTVWAMMLSAWFVVAWFLLTMADQVRPTALTRFHTLLWMYVISWLLLVLATVGEKNFEIASGYFLVIYNLSVFSAFLISYLELFGLPTRTKYVEHVAGAMVGTPRTESLSSRRLLDQAEDRPSSSQVASTGDEEATERTSLLGGGKSRSRSRDAGTFLGFAKRRMPETDAELDEDTDPLRSQAYGDEQAWSGSLPQSTWLLQFLLIGPINLILIGQIALALTSAGHQTPADGNPVLPLYMIFAGLAVLLMQPLAPFIHRFKFQIPLILLLVFAGCLAYNLLAFPFSRDARLKVFYSQQLNLTSGESKLSLLGVNGYVQSVIGELPSAAGQALDCSPSKNYAGTVNCTWDGLPPSVSTASSVPTFPNRYTARFKNSTKKASPYADWISYNITSSGNSALFTFQGRNTKICAIDFVNQLSSVSIFDAADDPRFWTDADKGTSQIRLYSRTWDKVFQVNVTWAEEKAKGQKGQVACLWNDFNDGQMPGVEEVLKFAPVWSVVSRAQPALLRGYKDFEI